MAQQTLEVVPYASAIGAEILGVDLAKPLDNAAWATIHDAFHKHLVIFFRDQHLTPDQQLAFARRFGQLEPYPYLNGIEGYPELFEVVKQPDEVKNFGSGWHADMTFAEQPPLGAVLYGMQIPPVGGDTLFANMVLAWDTLSEGMKAALSQLRGVHDSGDPKLHGKVIKENVRRIVTHHPFTRVHPVTGRTSLFISPDYCWQIAGMTREESRAILDLLERHATRHEFICRFRWQPNSIAVWDNRCTMHNAIEDDLGARLSGKGFKRVMRRATIRN